MTRNVEDCAVLLETIAGPDWIDLRTSDRPMPNPLPRYTKLLKEAREKAQREHPDAPLKGVRIGVLKEGFTVPKGDERVYEVAKDAIEGFKKLGAEIREISCPSHVQLSGPNSVATLLSGTAPFVGRSVGSKHLRLGSFWSKILPWTPEKWEKVNHRPCARGASRSAVSDCFAFLWISARADAQARDHLGRIRCAQLSHGIRYRFQLGMSRTARSSC
jgi:amidase